MVDLKQVNQVLQEFNEIVNTKKYRPFDKNKTLKVGVDLGTSSIVLAILDEQNKPIYGSFEYAEVVRDGLVVNYIQAVQIVTKLVHEAEEILGVELTEAATAVPPGTLGNDFKVVSNVLESAGLNVTTVVDEPSAAARLLDLEKGAVIDVGGGTTGISIIEDHTVVKTIDEPTGGTHMSLVLAGYHKVPVPEAELIKRDRSRESETFMIIKPVVDKMANITKQFLETYPIEPLFVVGGASFFDDFSKVFSKYLGKEVLRPDYPQFVTPIGIAIASEKE
ncbi:ethanolamine utilization protein EutJ [Vagococcus hydrophili]|uniref:Chaperone protein DnaK n=1 Tax=Vagococcus hydrophili TaxID=2714947 RepID=A0A6G8AUP2_9ENTE|nr:ethanolamine utilization protein EutJ [Vagococcus hydrophili]QIL48633.1 ethanolamine utilization protein EutJ [Vagococcus hydrophili]